MITKREQDVLNAIRELSESDQPYIKTLGEKLNMKKPNAVKYVQQLKKKGAIRHVYPLRINEEILAGLTKK